MIIYLEYSAEAIESVDKEHVEIILDRLITADRDSKHLIIINRPLVEWVEENLNIGDRNASYLKKIENKYKDRIQLLRECNISIKLHFFPQAQFEKNKNQYVISTEYFKGSKYHEETELVVENKKTDGKCYTLFLESLATNKTERTIGLKTHNGGGINVAVDTWKEVIGEKKIAYCIIDSDLATPKSKGTAAETAARECIINLGHNIAGFTKTPGRSVENLIPIQFYLDNNIIPNHQDTQLLLSLDEIDQPSPYADSFWAYFNTKQDFNFPDTKAFKQDEEVKWIQNKLHHLEQENIQIRIFPHKKKKVINEFLDNKAAQSKIADCIKSSIGFNHINDMLEELYWYCVSSNPKQMSKL